MDRQANIEKSIAYLAADEQVRCRIPSSPGERQRLLRALMNVWEPKELPEEFLAMQDAELQAQAADKRDRKRQTVGKYKRKTASVFTT